MAHESDSIGSLLHHTASLLSRQADQVLQEQLGIGFSQFKILRSLQISPNVKQQQIAHNLGQTEASISRQVKIMTTEGLLESRRNPNNRREHITIATPKGERVIAAALQALDRYYAPTFRHLSDKEQQHLLSGLQALHGAVCTQPHEG